MPSPKILGYKAKVGFRIAGAAVRFKGLGEYDRADTYHTLEDLAHPLHRVLMSRPSNSKSGRIMNFTDVSGASKRQAVYGA